MPDTLQLRPPILLPIIIVLLAGGFYIYGKNIETRDRTVPTITVSGEGKTFANPDIAELNLGIETGRQATAKEAMKKLSDGMNAVFAAVKGAGVAEKDIKTASFNLSPIYDYTQSGQVFRGFQASQSLTVKVRDLDKASDVLSAATAAGANQAGGVNFTVDDPEAARSIAREEAVTKARAKAEKIAQDLGMRLGRVQSFNEGGGYTPPIMMMRKDMAVGAPEAASIPLPPGQQEVDVSVNITYELK